MKKLITFLTIFFFVATPTWALAATYYACAAQEITAAGTFKVDAACTGDTLTWASLANGDVLDANAFTVSIENNVGASDKQVTLQTGAAGGGFTIGAATYPNLVLYTHITAGTTTVLTISGAMEAGESITVHGNITGGTGADDNGIRTTHTVGKLIIGGTVTGGASASACGIMATGNGLYEITGNVTGATGPGLSITTTTAGSFITGTVTGGNGSGSATGAESLQTAALTINGSLVNGTRATAVRGSIIWNPTVPSNGVNGHYIKFDGGGTALYVGRNTETQSKANTDFYYFISTSGTSQAGTDGGATSGWAWGF
jgi:hypothetical protein